MKIKSESGRINFKIILLILIIIIAIAAVVVIRLNKNKKITFTEVITYNYFPLYTLDDKTGVVDREGNIVIEPKYVDIFIPNPALDVFACVDEEGNTDFLNKEGKQLFTQYEGVGLVFQVDSESDIESGVLSYVENEKYGLIDLNGIKLTDAIYDDVASLVGRPGAILVKKDWKYGLLDSKGTQIIECNYNTIKADDYSSQHDGYNKTGYIVSVKKDDGVFYGYIDYEGNKILDTNYESISRVSIESQDDIYLIVMQNGKKGVLKNGKQLIKTSYQSIRYSGVSQIFVVEKTRKYGFIDINGKEILRPAYTNYAISNGYITIEEDGKVVMYDFNGNIVKTNAFKTIQEVEDTSYFIAQDNDGKYTVISKDVSLNDKYASLAYAYDDYFIFSNDEGKYGVLHVWEGIVVEPIYAYILPISGVKAIEARLDNNEIDVYDSKMEKIISEKDGVVIPIDDKYTAIYNDSKMYYINSSGNIVQNNEVFPNNSIYAVEKDGKWGFQDRNGTIVVPCIYDLVTEINEYGFAGVCQGGLWGVISQNGDVIVNPSYEIEFFYLPSFVGKYRLVANENVVCYELESK